MEKIHVFVKMSLQGWETYIKRVDDLLKSLTQEQLSKEISPGRNTGVYLLGHLVTIHDKMFPILGLGQMLYPDLEKPFLSTPDKSGLEFPAITELLACWTEVNRKLWDGFNAMPLEDWFERHALVSAEDFAKEPFRNKLNIVLNRTGHLAYHYGQLRLLK